MTVNNIMFTIKTPFCHQARLSIIVLAIYQPTCTKGQNIKKKKYLKKMYFPYRKKIVD